ncbi:hypothetical protein AB0M48_08715 [Lentzea sp. NPDC051208]|uniref:hypothetical protein n=1 Tax=Lentzea sp. NPDC051208 TaxID=3154642 RepID=UPI003430CD0A
MFAEWPHWDAVCRDVQTGIERGDDYGALTDVLVRHAHQLSDDDMVAALTVLVLELRAQDREEEEDGVMDLLDLLTGWCSGGQAVWLSMRPVVG